MFLHNPIYSILFSNFDSKDYCVRAVGLKTKPLFTHLLKHFVMEKALKHRESVGGGRSSITSENCQNCFCVNRCDTHPQRMQVKCNVRPTSLKCCRGRYRAPHGQDPDHIYIFTTSDTFDKFCEFLSTFSPSKMWFTLWKKEGRLVLRWQQYKCNSQRK